MELTDDVKFVKGVGPNRVKLLNKLNIYNLEDLITYYPREYEDRSKPKKIANTENGEECLIEGIVTSHIKEIRTHRKNMIIYKLIVRDDTDSCELVWYNQSYLKKMFRIGETYKFFGRINKRIGQTEMVSPVYDLEGNNKHTGRIIPIYPLTYSLSQNTLRHIIEEGLKQAKDKIAETLPEYILEEYKLMKLKNALQSIHLQKELKGIRNNLIINPLGEWTGGVNVDSGATNRKLGSDMAKSITGGGLHGKDLSKADVSINIYAFKKAQELNKTVEICCAIGDEYIDNKPYEEIVEEARTYIKELGGFEKFAEWGLY